MSAHKHTPGPWAVVGDGSRVKPEPVDLFFQPIADVNAEIRWENGNWVRKGNVEANARLIAAAPDLLAALEMALIWLDYEGKYDVQGIRTAIAKATGAA